MNAWNFVLLFQLLTAFVVILDAPFVRQLVGFIYLTFLPGFVLLGVLRMRTKSMVQIIVFSAALSLFLLMSVGLLVNEIFKVLGIQHPLSFWPLFIVVNGITLFLTLLGYMRERSFDFVLSFGRPPLWTLLFCFLPILSFAGTFAVNSGGSSSLLLLLIAMIAVLFLVYVLLRANLSHSKFNSMVLFALMISVLLQTSLTTSYITGYDVYEEFFVFKLTQGSASWNSSIISTNPNINKVNGMLSVTILPTIYSELLRFEANYLFKIMYPFILSLLAFALYAVYRTQFNESIAFLSVFFFMSQFSFINLFSSRQIVAEFFFVSLLIVMFSKNLDRSKRNILFMIFGAALIVSHYSLTYIFIVAISLIWASQFIMKRTSMISLSQLLYFFVLALGWYVYTTGASSFTDLVNTSSFIWRNLYTDFLNPAARGSLVLSAVGGGSADSIFQQFGRGVFYISELLIAVGFIKLLVSRWRKTADVKEGFVLLVFMNLALLMMSIVIPNFAGSLGVSRLHQIALLTLAPLGVLGGMTVLNQVSKRRIRCYTSTAIISIYLVAFFLFQSGFVYAVARDVNWSLPLAIRRGKVENFALYEKIVNQQEVVGAQWLGEKASFQTTIVSADAIAVAHHLTAYGMISFIDMRTLSNSSVVDTGGRSWSYIYLRGVNVKEGIMVGPYLVWNTTDLISNLPNADMIYSNPECNILLWLQD